MSRYASSGTCQGDFAALRPSEHRQRQGGAQTSLIGEEMQDDNRRYGSSRHCCGGDQKRCQVLADQHGTADSQYSQRQTKQVRCYSVVDRSGFWGNANPEKYKRMLDGRQRPNP